MKKIRRKHAVIGAAVVLAAVAVGLFAFAAFAGGADNVGAANPAVLLCTTTTSVNDTGLLTNVIEPAYEARYPGIDIQFVAKGSGAALADGVAGNTDVVITHAPADEKLFVSQGHFTARLPFAYNYFTVVGRESDPANVAGARSAVSAFKRIAAWGAAKMGRVAFVSRGDNSGTNKKELELWAKAGITIDPASPPAWYMTANTGMLATLQITAQKKAYTLTDVATWIKNKTSASLSPPLVRLLTTRTDLKNQYSILLVNANDHPAVNTAGAESLAQWLTSKTGQQALGAYKMGKTVMFYPNSYTISTTANPPLATP